LRFLAVRRVGVLRVSRINNCVVQSIAERLLGSNIVREIELNYLVYKLLVVGFYDGWSPFVIDGASARLSCGSETIFGVDARITGGGIRKFVEIGFRVIRDQSNVRLLDFKLHSWELGGNVWINSLFFFK
jgi:hypothetical protein